MSCHDTYLANAVILFDVCHVQVRAVSSSVLVAVGEARCVKRVGLEVVLLLRVNELLLNEIIDGVEHLTPELGCVWAKLWQTLIGDIRFLQPRVNTPHLKLVQELVRLIKEVEGVHEDDLHCIDTRSASLMLVAADDHVRKASSCGYLMPLSVLPRTNPRRATNLAEVRMWCQSANGAFGDLYLLQVPSDPHLDFAACEEVEPVQQVQDAHVAGDEGAREGRPLEVLHRCSQDTERLLLPGSCNRC